MQITIMVGPSGSGKSTEVAGILRNISPSKIFRLSSLNESLDIKAAVLSADDVTYDDDGFHPEKIGEAHARCLRVFIGTLMQTNDLCNIEHLIVDNTNTTASELAPYIAIAAALNAPINISVCQVAWQEGMDKSIHNVPWYVVKRQCRQLERLLDEWPPFWPQPEFTER